MWLTNGCEILGCYSNGDEDPGLQAMSTSKQLPMFWRGMVAPVSGSGSLS